MTFYADLHIHSKHSRATSKDCDLEHLAFWARKKGIALVGTGDFTHPAWLAELKDKLIPAEPGLFRLRPDLERTSESWLPPSCQGAVRFLLSVEISTIYKSGERTRKVHHLVYAPDFACAERIVRSLSKVGNLASDGRPILGLDSRHLLEIVLESGPHSFLVPAHIWTPWFAALGSKSGFDAIDDCYGDLASHVFAVETGLSSDPPMNWRVSHLDRFRLMSNSDAHSPEKIGREACTFDTDLDYFAIRQALDTGRGYGGTVEFFPEEGKYHLDGHRNCKVRFTPRETRQMEGKCPVCQNPVTVGVMHRVEELTDREDTVRPATSGEVQSLVPLPEVLAEIEQVGAKSRRVSQLYEGLLRKLGPELMLLNDLPLEDIRKAASSLVAEAVSRLRNGRVIREAGFDGVYGTIRLFQEEELRCRKAGPGLFHDDTRVFPALDQSRLLLNAVRQRLGAGHDPSEGKRGGYRQTSHPAESDHGQGSIQLQETGSTGSDVLFGLDHDQLGAVEFGSGPLLIVAGPGSGKTKTLSHRIACVISRGVPAAECLAVTFTKRAADEMRGRLQRLLPKLWDRIALFTFHALGHSILQEHWNRAALQRGFRVVADRERLRLLQDSLRIAERQARSLLSLISRAKRTQEIPAEPKSARAFEIYQRELEVRNLVDYDDLIGRAVDLLESDAGLKIGYQQRYRWVFVDEYQDVDQQQVRLLKQLVPRDGNLCVIGDPDQAIYSFRGGDVRFFKQFQDDFPTAHLVRLKRNYRSDRNIVAVSTQVIAGAGSEQRSIPVLEGIPSLITIHEAATEKAEAEFVVQTIEQALGGHSFFSIDSGRSRETGGDHFSFSDFAVLYRTEAQTEALVEALQRSGMPFQRHSHAALMDHPGVSVLIDAMLAGPRTGSLREQLETAVNASRHGADAEPLLEEATAAREAIELLEPVADGCGEDLERFLSQLVLQTQADTWNPRAGRISLLTLHAAKGLEFPVVFITGCEDTILPLTWGKAQSTGALEERRLFYVGMTRAKAKLYLCHARKRVWRGRVREMAPSPYLADIEESLLERRSADLRGGGRKGKKAQLELF